MGNHLSCKVDVTEFFVGPMPKTIPSFTVRINAQDVYENFSATSFDLVFSNTLYVREVSAKSAEPNYTWTVPRSRARDFEVVDAFTPQKRELAQGQVIGVVIVECLEAYCKIFWPNFEDRTENHKLDNIFTIWNHTEEAKKLLTTDLSLGYSVLYVAGEEGKNIQELCDVADSETRRDAKIFIPSLKGKGLSNFEDYIMDRLKNKKQKHRVDDSDDEKEENTKKRKI